ncbi:MAG: inositol monophosphatase family protein [Candidatus Eisenbacteria bacterium]
MSDITTWMEAALEAARLAGRVALGHWRRELAVERKEDGSPVTLADRAAERVAREWIAGRFPADGILGEEFGLERGDAPRRWTVDPIDGTKSFVRGVPLWGSLVALCEGDRVLAGAAVFPALDESLVAGPGEGCWHDGTRCRVSEVARLADATILATDAVALVRGAHADGLAALARGAGVTRTWGDAAGYLLVATGRAEMMLDLAMKPWDSAPLQPIIEEAGGVFTDWTGRATAFGDGTLATNATLATVVRATLGIARR